MGTAGENFCDSAAISLKILAVPWLKFTQYTLRILRPDRPGHLLLRAQSPKWLYDENTIFEFITRFRNERLLQHSIHSKMARLSRATRLSLPLPWLAAINPMVTNTACIMAIVKATV